jgi:ring-1,2-phenylacetyl-CoA epoxidase subunit PaaA
MVGRGKVVEMATAHAAASPDGDAARELESQFDATIARDQRIEPRDWMP